MTGHKGELPSPSLLFEVHPGMSTLQARASSVWSLSPAPCCDHALDTRQSRKCSTALASMPTEWPACGATATHPATTHCQQAQHR